MYPSFSCSWVSIWTNLFDLYSSEFPAWKIPSIVIYYLMINHILVFKVHIGCCSQMVLNEVIFQVSSEWILYVENHLCYCQISCYSLAFFSLSHTFKYLMTNSVLSMFLFYMITFLMFSSSCCLSSLAICSSLILSCSSSCSACCLSRISRRFCRASQCGACLHWRSRLTQVWMAEIHILNSTHLFKYNFHNVRAVSLCTFRALNMKSAMTESTQQLQAACIRLV